MSRARKGMGPRIPPETLDYIVEVQNLGTVDDDICA